MAEQAGPRAGGEAVRRAGREAGRKESEGSVGRFQAERRALRKIQVHFEFQQSVLRKVRMAAAADNLSYADYVRKTVGLPYAKRQRPRISLSFSEADIANLAERYGMPASEPAVLKRCVMDEINARLSGDRSKSKHA